MNSKKILVYTLFYFSYVCVFAQQVAVYPDFSSVFNRHLGLVNSSINSSESGNYLFFSTKQRPGPLSKISTHFLSLEKKFHRQKKDGHLIRINLINENEGPYIQRTRVYGGYAYKILVKKDWDFAFGTNVGYAGAFYSAPSATSIDNSNAFDGAIGLSSKWKEFKIGISYLQMLNSNFSKDGFVQLKPYYVLLLNYAKEVSPKSKVETYIIANLYTTQVNTTVLKANYAWSNLIGGGAYYHSRNGLGLEIFLYPKFEDYRGTLGFAYNANSFSSTTSSAVFRSYELSFGLDF